MRIESGPAKQWTTRILLMFVAFDAISMWFGYDGWYGWPATKQEYRARGLSPELAASIQIDPRVTAALNGRSPREVSDALPGLTPINVNADKRYDGPDGYLLTPTTGASRAVWYPAWKRESEINLQKLIAIVIGIVSLGVLVRFVFAARTRVVVDDEGLRTSPTRLIPFAQMQRLNTDEYRQKYWVDLVYSDAGADRKLRLDSYQLANFDALVNALCEKKGWVSPVADRRPQA